MPESRQQRLRSERMAQREAVWDPGEPPNRADRPGSRGPDPLRPRWRWIHPDPYGGHGSSTAASFDKCQCRDCAAQAAADARHRSRERAAVRGDRRRGARPASFQR